jgi:hypothetical protein
LQKSVFKAICRKIVSCDKSIAANLSAHLLWQAHGGLMKVTLIFLSLVILGEPALGQSGVSNQRDMYGNLVRNGGTASTGVNQSVPNNGAIRNAPVQTPTNPKSPSQSQQINRIGSGTN